MRLILKNEREHYIKYKKILSRNILTRGFLQEIRPLILLTSHSEEINFKYNIPKQIPSLNPAKTHIGLNLLNGREHTSRPGQICKTFAVFYLIEYIRISILIRKNNSRTACLGLLSLCTIQAGKHKAKALPYVLIKDKSRRRPILNCLPNPSV
ncbi:MAG: hypothetical protein QY310_07975 [Candidatus Jettenia sp. CY-1]|nr:hypothetical protein [Candidatus Jettenia sp.]WKZ20489.1 MAG: hypothetical protein QY310_07975 [Candidatus Jettenia sp. CY-1]